ncbi:MAG TPA: hypothetical protein VGI41_05325 [Candidatus Udaeobacter sp.]
MNLETADGISVERDVLSSFTVARLARDPELRDLRIPCIAWTKRDWPCVTWQSIQAPFHAPIE